MEAGFGETQAKIRESAQLCLSPRSSVDAGNDSDSVGEGRLRGALLVSHQDESHHIESQDRAPKRDVAVSSWEVREVR